MINNTQFEILKYLKDCNAIMKRNIFNVAGTLEMSYSSASQQLGILEALELIKSIVTPSNRKKKFYSITDVGIAAIIEYAFEKNKKEEGKNNETNKEII